MKKLLNVLTLVFLLVACSVDGHHGNGDDNFFSAFTTFPDTRWAYSDPQIFTVDTLADSISAPGALVLTLRHSPAYAYSNIWIELRYDLDDSLARADTINLILADPHGRWRGSGLGNSFRISDTLRTASLKRHQRIQLRHIMRTDTLDAIEQIGVSFLP